MNFPALGFLFIGLVSLLVQVGPVAAHNGAVAFAVPVEGLIVDGDLSDWPVGMRDYPVEIPGGGNLPVDRSDLQAVLRLGYDKGENALYAAVTVQDQSVVVESREEGSWSRDGCEIYIEIQHLDEPVELAQYVLWGEQRQAFGMGKREEIDVAVRRDGGGYRYEWRVDIGRLSGGQVQLGDGVRLGFDVALFDRDEDGSVTKMLWGRGDQKDRRAEEFGDLLLVERMPELHPLQGQLRWAGLEEGVARATVEVVPEEGDLRWEVETDRQGHFGLEVPTGSYRVRPAVLGRGDRPSAAVEVEAGAPTNVELEVPLPSGEVRPLGKGWGHWRHFGEVDGLPSMHTNQVARDGAGYMWFASDFLGSRGAVRYDGENFVLFTEEDGLPSHVVHALQADQSGAMWLGTDRGAVRYDGERFETFTTVDGLAADTVYALHQDRSGTMWLGTSGGVSRYRDGRLAIFADQGELNGEIRAVFQDRTGAVWFGTYGQGAVRYDGATFARFTKEDGLASNKVWALGEDGSGDLWLGTNGGASRYTGTGFGNFTGENGLAGIRVLAVYRDGYGYLWFGTNNGAYRYHGEVFEHIVVEGTQRDYVRNFAEDRDGHLWLGTSGGASRYDGRTLTTFTAADGLPSSEIHALLLDGAGRLWLSLGSTTTDSANWKLCRLEGDSLRLYTAADGLFDEISGEPFQDRIGHLWFGTTNGHVFRYDGRTFSRYTAADGLPGSRVRMLAEDRLGRLWLSTWAGDLVRFDGRRFVQFPASSGWPSLIYGIKGPDRDDYLWFSGHTGAIRMDGAQWGTGSAPPTDMRFQHFTSAEGLGHEVVINMLVDRQERVWAATVRGLSRFNGERFATYTSADGLTSENTNSLFEDRRGHLWIGTWGGGFNRFDGRIFQGLTAADGLPANTSHYNRVVAETADGDLWVGTSRGLVRYRLGTSKPPVHLTDVQTDLRHGPVDSLVVPSWQALLAFEFQGISFRTRPGRLVYGYRLKGYQDEWQWTRAKRVEYNDIPVGQYTFEVQAVDRDLNYSATPATVEVEIAYRPQGSPVRLAQVELDDLFSSFHASYAHQPLGRVEVANEAPRAVDATLRFFVPGLMDQPFDWEISLSAQASQTVDLTVPFDARLLDRPAASALQAEVELAYQAGDEILSRRQRYPFTLYGPGALRWDEVARAAAFITPTDAAVAAFARPILVDFEQETGAWGKPLDNILQAMVLFESLKAHGVRYVADANTPYAQVRTDQATIDHIQYPAETLHSKAGDCDDLTVLYAALLENAGIATALVDYPGHIFLLVDTGVHRESVAWLPFDERFCLMWGDQLWIPVEVTQLDQSFEQAWRLGAEQLAGMPKLELRQQLVRTAQAWRDYPAAAPSFADTVQAPARTILQTAFDQQYAALQGRVKDHIQTTYLDALIRQPDNDALRSGLLKLYLELRRYEAAISAAQDHLLDEQGEPGRTHNQLGIAHFLKGDIKQAALHFKQAAGLKPEDSGIRKNLERALEALGRAAPVRTDGLAAAATAQGPKAEAVALAVDSFYWMD
ncbi:MAG: hypothetical protein GKR89_30535 [Candidatus Latescibacteria bacterium]|nr:hypothetical protein [Candidatus Latescibacterota bacterium]